LASATDLGGEALIGALDLAEPAFAQDQLALAEVGPVDREDLDPRSVEEAGDQVRCLQRVFIEEPLDMEIVDRKIEPDFTALGRKPVAATYDMPSTTERRSRSTSRRRSGSAAGGSWW
jgi:hypothetical protein